MDSKEQLDLERIERILEQKPHIDANPFATVPRQSLLEALKVIEEFSEELTIDS
jgi:hypothetical protein